MKQELLDKANTLKREIELLEKIRGKLFPTGGDSRGVEDSCWVKFGGSEHESYQIPGFACHAARDAITKRIEQKKQEFEKL